MRRAVVGMLVAACSRTSPIARDVETNPFREDDVAIGATVGIDDFEFPHCAIEAVVFLNDMRGWVRDRCGALFATTDGGRTFALVRHSTNSASSAPLLVVGDDMLDFGGGPVLDVAEGGRAPLRQRFLPSYGPWVAAASAGASVWACASDGTILVSSDRGNTFAIAQRKPAISACTAIGATSADHAIVSDVDRKLWVTRDGGSTWRLLGPRVNDAVEQIAHAENDKWFLVSGRVAPVLDEQSETLTPHAGIPHELPPTKTRTRTAYGMISIDQARGRLFVERGSKRRWIPIRPAAKRFERIVGIRREAGWRTAWTDHGVLVQEDANDPLVVVAFVDEGPLASASHPAEGEWLARNEAGGVYRWPGGRTHEDPPPPPHRMNRADGFTAWRLMRAEAEAAGEAAPASPAHALLARDGELTISINHADCSDLHAPVTYTLRRTVPLSSLSIESGTSGTSTVRVLRDEEAEKIVGAIDRALVASPQGNYSTQRVWIELRVGTEQLAESCVYPSPRGRALLAAMGDPDP